jgi:hypothetical protein
MKSWKKQLRGTGQRVWRGLAPGTRKNAGFFRVGKPGSKQIVLCESAIDAISCFQLHAQLDDARLPTDPICISTAGVRPDAPWLRPLLACGYDIYCGFDLFHPRARHKDYPQVPDVRSEVATSPGPRSR